jgi:hypothetical protein
MTASRLAIEFHHFCWYRIRAGVVKSVLINALILVDKLRAKSV